MGASDPVVGARAAAPCGSHSQPRAASSHSHRLHTQACTERTPSLENSVPLRPSHKTVLRGVRNTTVWHSDAKNRPHRPSRKSFLGQSCLVQSLSHMVEGPKETETSTKLLLIGTVNWPSISQVAAWTPRRVSTCTGTRRSATWGCRATSGSGTGRMLRATGGISTTERSRNLSTRRLLCSTTRQAPRISTWASTLSTSTR